MLGTFVLALGMAATAPGERAGMRGARYCEVFVVARHLGRMRAEVYNTLGLNDCSDAAWARVDPAILAKQLRAKLIVKNGPRYFLMDSSSYTVPGKVATFAGLQARLVAEIAIPMFRPMGDAKQPPYKERAIKRQTVWRYLARRPLYELHAPGGKTYVMQSYALIVDPRQTQASLSSLGRRLKLPPGWSYQVVRPTADVLVTAVDGTAHIVQDELQNTYQLH